MRPEFIPANTAEWVAARRGILTASKMFDALAVSKRDGKPLKARSDLIRSLVVERLAEVSTPHFVTDAMQWGIDYEEAAVSEYEIKAGTLCSEAGLFMHPTIKFLGATPDRLVGSDGIVEAKCPTPETHYTYWLNKTLPDDYEPQVMTQLAVTGRQWCDFISYHPSFPEHMRLVVVRVDRNPARIAEIEAAAETLLAEVKALVDEAWKARAA